MARGQSNHQPLIAQQDAAHVRVFIADAAEAHVDAAVLERLDLVHGGHLVHGQIDHRVLHPKPPDDLRQHPVQRRGNKADRQAPLDLADALRHRGQFSRLRQQLARVRVEEAASLGQLERAATALEQQHADFLFQLLNLSRERRLCDMQALGRAGEVQFFSDGHEVA